MTKHVTSSDANNHCKATSLNPMFYRYYSVFFFSKLCQMINTKPKYYVYGI